tara:strand:+ start:102 stop:452 length:351 start_codon:yes stop_codon:yes gene_type:complete
MTILSRPQIVFNEVTTETTTSDWTNDTVTVVWTATMQNGSILDDSNVEIAALGAANGTKVINDASEAYKDHQVGDTVAINVAVQGCVFNSSALTYSDGAAVPANLTALAAKLNTFK